MDQTGLKLLDLPASVCLPVLGLKVYTTTACNRAGFSRELQGRSWGL